ncbi:acryloyl-CoA reductase [Pseudonocardia broussonetiae]|uniref:Acryloyl-CoA reductase n=1 Tax=Pseudonocardia broussonetiae TaxID=2736640 RepID=A0A6M6JNP0_9PSEU|nr:acryloyl-CoA reductase [Pseudonocardia broussonetiae]QJY48059.1 acryloyl-CoA reductase [Pseudonocardia broussonetiae]
MSVRSFRALEVDEDGDGYAVRLVERLDADLPDGDVVVDVRWSDLNYKDGLIMSGRFGLVRRFPMTAGIDLVGTVVESGVAEVPVGRLVTVNGNGLGTDHPGGLAERARVPHAWVTPVPEPIDALSAAAIGTAGYTAALAVLALRGNGVEPGSGPVLVTGAAGGAGSIAVLLLAALGHEVVASTGRRRMEEESLLRLGASSVVDRLELLGDGELGRASWAGAIDTLGSRALATVLARTRYGGTVAAMGMAMGVDLPTSVVPFISRAVTLAGIDSVHAPPELRRDAWQLLADHLDLAALRGITEVVPLEQAAERSRAVMAGTVRGRLVVDVRA